MRSLMRQDKDDQDHAGGHIDTADATPTSSLLQQHVAGSSHDMAQADGVFATSDSDSRATSVLTPVHPLPTKKKYEDLTTIDFWEDGYHEWNRQRELHQRGQQRKIQQHKKAHWHSRYASLWDASQGWIVITIVGGMAGVIAGIINICIEWLNDIKLGVCPKAWFLSRDQCCWGETLTGTADCAGWQNWSDLMDTEAADKSYAINYFMYLLLAAVLSAMAGFLVKRLAPYAAGSGLAEIKVILGGFIIRGYFGFWTLVVKSFGIILALSSGLNVGNEGPMVHISCCIGNVCTRWFHKFNTNEAKRREILSAAAAIGVAAAFNAPIGGVLYSLEEVAYYFPHKTMWRAFFGCLCAAITLSYLNPLNYREGLFNDRTWHWFEFPAIVIIGVFGVRTSRT